MYLYGVPQLWQVYTLSNLEKQKEIIGLCQKDKETGKINHVEVLQQLLKKPESWPRYESLNDLYERSKKIKSFMAEYLRCNPLNVEKIEKYGVICHSRILSALTAKSISDKGDLEDFKWFQNCEMQPFFDF